MAPHRLAVERLAVAAAAMSIAAPAVAMATRALGGSVWIAAAMAAGPFFAVPMLSRQLPKTLDGFAQTHRVLAVLWCVVVLVAVGQLARLAVFIDAPLII